MAVDQASVAKVERLIAESKDGALSLRFIPFLDVETTRQILKMIAERMPGLIDWDVEFNGGNLKALLPMFVAASQGLSLRDGTALINCIRSLDISYSTIPDTSFRFLVNAVLVGQLPRLSHLTLTAARLTELSLTLWAVAARGGRLRRLSHLTLTLTQLTEPISMRWADAALAGQLPQLSELSLSYTAVKDESLTRWAEAACAGQLPRLSELDLTETEVTDASLRWWWDAFREGQIPKLKSLKLNNTGVTVPPSVLHSGDADTIFQWYRDRIAASAPLPEAKLLIVGEGCVGKSVLCRRLFAGKDETAPPDSISTCDFDMYEYQLPADLLAGDELSPLKLRVWDFGGQDFLHGSHRFFVGAERAFYLLVLNASKDARANKLTYWLRFLAQHGTRKAGETRMRAPVLIVYTQSDKLLSAQEGKGPNPVTVLQNYDELLTAVQDAREKQFFDTNVIGEITGLGYPKKEDFSALTPESQSLLTEQHRNACRQIRQTLAEHLDKIIFLCDKVTLGDRKIRDWVLEHFMPQEGKVPLTRFRLDQDPFRSWALEQKLDQQDDKPPSKKLMKQRVKTSLGILKSLGLVHWVGDDQNQDGKAARSLSNVIFNPWWVKTPVYRALRAEKTHNLNGWVSPGSLEKTLPRRAATQFPKSVTAENVRDWFDSLQFTERDREIICELLVHSGLLFEVRYGHQMKGWLIPDLLEPQPKPDNLPTGDVPLFKYPFDFLPERVLLLFLAKVLIEAYNTPEQLDATRREQFHRQLYRNAACLPWRLPGHDAQFEVRIRTEVNPPLEERPWLSITVSGGDKSLHILVLNEVIRELNTTLDSEGLEARISPQRLTALPTTSPMPVSPDLSVDMSPARETSSATSSNKHNQHKNVPSLADSVRPPQSTATLPIALPEDPELILKLSEVYGISVENLRKPIPKDSIDEAAEQPFRLFHAICTAFAQTDDRGFPVCGSLAEVIRSLEKKESADNTFRFSGSKRLNACRNYVYACRKKMDHFFADHFRIERLKPRLSRLLEEKEKGKGFDGLTDLGRLAWQRVQEALSAQSD